MEKTNYKNIITIALYFFLPAILFSIVDILNITLQNKIIGKLSLDLVLFIMIIFMYRKDLHISLVNIKDNFNKSIKNILILFVSIIVTQVLVNTLSLIILGDSDKIINSSALVKYLKDYPLLMTLMMVIYYPIIETIIFSKIFRDIIDNKWMFIIISSLFFWITNIVSFGISFDAMIITLSCLTSTIVINNFYYKNNNIVIIFIVKMIYNLIFILLP